MTQKVWQHGDYAKVGDLVRVFNGYRQVVGVGIVVEKDRKPFAGPVLHVALPDFDYEKEAENG